MVLYRTPVVTLAKVEDQPGRLPCADEHAQLNLLPEGFGVFNVDNHLAVRGVLVSKGGPRVGVLTRGTEEGPLAFTFILLPQVCAFAIVHARVRITLRLPGTTFCCVLLLDRHVWLDQTSSKEGVLPHLPPIDRDVFHASNEINGLLSDKGLRLAIASTKVSCLESFLASIVRVDLI